MARRAGVPRDIVDRNLKRAGDEDAADLEEHFIEVQLHLSHCMGHLAAAEHELPGWQLRLTCLCAHARSRVSTALHDWDSLRRYMALGALLSSWTA